MRILPKYSAPSRQRSGVVVILKRWIAELRSSVWGLNLCIYAAYGLVTLIVTYPAIKGLIHPYVVPGVGDSRYFLWHIWWIKHALLDLGISPAFTNAIYHPMGGEIFLLTPLNELKSVTLQPLIGLTRTYTFLWLFSFATAGFTTYLLGFYFTHNRGAAFVGGLIYSFSARHYAQAMENINISAIQWLPLYALALFLLLKRPRIKTAVFTAVALALAILSEYVYYVFYFVVPTTVLFIVYFWFTKHPTLRQRRFWFAFIGASLVAVLLVMSFYLPLLRNRDEEFIRGGGLTTYSADVLAYFTPAERHPAWHALVAPVYENFEGNEEEQTVFIGYTAIILTLFAVGLRQGKSIEFWLLLGVTAFIFSLGPILHVNGEVKLAIPGKDLETYMPMPYLLLTNLPFISLLRAPARLSVTVQLAVAVLATAGLTTLTRHWHSAQRAVVYTGLGLFILFESLFQFPYYVDVTSLIPPAIYSVIAQEKNDLAVLEIPSRKESGEAVPVKNLGFNTYYFMYYATVHQHPLVGGYAGRVPPTVEAFFDTTAFVRELMYPMELVKDATDTLKVDKDELALYGAEMLAKHGIGYVIVHRDLVAQYFPEPGPSVPETVLRQALGAPFYDDGTIAGFRVPQTGTPVQSERESMLWGDGWYPETSNFDGRTLRWMRSKASLLIHKNEPAAMRLSMTAFPAMSSDITVTMTVNGALIGEFEVFFTPPGPDTVLTRPFSLMAGHNEIKLEANSPEEPMQQIDPRVYLGVQNIDLQSTLDVATVAPMYRRQVNLDNKVEFIGFDLNTDKVHTGENLHLTLYWHALDVMDKDYLVFVHITDSEGNLRMQHDGIPREGTLPTSYWGRGEAVADEHDIAVPADAPSGEYQVWIGMYSLDTMQRLRIHDGDSLTADDSILLGNLYVESSQ